MKTRIAWALPALLAGALALPAAPDKGDKAEKKAKADGNYSLVYLGDDRPILIRLHLGNEGKSLEAAWDRFIDEVFKYLDVDGDGSLDKREAERAPDVSVLFGGNGLGFGPFPPALPGGRGGRGESLFAQMDTNKDGKVSRDELAAYYRRNGAAPFQYGGPQGRSTRLRAPGQAAVAYQIANPGAPSNADAINDALFKLLDTNKDGKLSREELKAAPEILMKLDANDDEVVSLDELLPGARGGGFGGGGGGFAVVQAYDPDGRLDGAFGRANFILVAPGEPSPALAKALLERYGKKGDKTTKKKLTIKDIRLDKDSFELLDKDGDGELDAEELARFADRKPDLALKVDVGQTKDADKAFALTDVDGKASPLADKVKKGVAGTMTLNLGNVRIDLRNGEDGGANTVFRVNIKQQYIMQFDAADTANKGYLEKKDVERNAFFRGSFDQMDRDGDGKLYKKEMLAYLDAMEDLQKAARKACVSMSVSDSGQGLFDLIDTDHDGRLSLRELRNMVKLIDQLDTDGDGCISREEIPRRFQVSFRQGPATQADPFAGRVVVVNKFGNAPTGAPMPERTKGPLWFRKMDRNRDGDVSRREFLGTDEEFKAIDEDGDGLISAEEAERYDKKHRKATTTEEAPRGRQPER